jgi:hypothetical protein
MADKSPELVEIHRRLTALGLNAGRVGALAARAIDELLLRGIPPLEIAAILRLAELAHSYAEGRVGKAPDFHERRAEIIRVIEEGHGAAKKLLDRSFD